MASTPRDRFDEIPDDLVRVGAHRGPRRKGGGWVGFAWAVLATGVLVLGGLVGVNRVLGVDVGLPFLEPAATPTPTPTPTPTADPITAADFAADPRAANFRITVLNGSNVLDLQNLIGDELRADGWPIGGTLVASSTDIEDTFVYYSDPANEDVARGLVESLGEGDVRLVTASTFPGSAITIVLGTSFRDLGAPSTPEPTPSQG